MIRDATYDDAAAVASIYNESIEARDSTMQLASIAPEEVGAWLREFGDREAMLVLEEGGEVTGYGLIRRYSARGGYRFTAETSVYVRRSETDAGRGSRLQEALVERCRAYDYHHLVAKLWAENERSRALHRKFGYELVGIQDEIGWVDGAWRDVAIMQKVIT